MEHDRLEPTDDWPKSEIVAVNNDIKKRASSIVFGSTQLTLAGQEFELLGIGIHGMQSGSSHRSLDDGSDYFIGSANFDLSQIAYGSDAPRYLRAICVPMNMTRYAVSALIHADSYCVERLLNVEKDRFKILSSQNETTKEDKKRTESKSEAVMNLPLAQTSESETGNARETTVAPSEEVHPESIEVSENKPDHASSQSAAKSIGLVPKVFEKSCKLRGSICSVLLYYGFPFISGKKMDVCKSLWRSVLDHCATFDDLPADNLFDAERFIFLIKEMAGVTLEIPDFDTIREYVIDYLLPHCLRLCLMGNGPTLENARGSKGEYKTALGISLYPEPTENRQCSLPDPCLPMEEHSVEAVASAYAIMRRAQLMKSAMEIAIGRISMEKLQSVLRSPFMCKSMAGLPVWWCPWIHDAALLVHAATRGLFSILKDRQSDDTSPLAFAKEKIMQHMQSAFISDDSALPPAVVHSAPEDAGKWIDYHAQQFPTANVLERRLAFLCAKATESLTDDDARYYNLPMFDHGAWPRN